MRARRPARAVDGAGSGALPLPAQLPSGCMSIIQAENLARHYDISRGAFRQLAVVRALDGATFAVEAGNKLAVVGESGCGKSTLARLLTMIEPPTAGRLVVDGVDVATGGA